MVGRQLLIQETWVERPSDKSLGSNTSNHLVKISQPFIYILRSYSVTKVGSILIYSNIWNCGANTADIIPIWLTFLFFNNGFGSSTAGYNSSLTGTPSSWHLNVNIINDRCARKAFILMKWYKFCPYLPTQRTDTSLTSHFLAFLHVAGWPFLKTTCVTCLVNVFETWMRKKHFVYPPNILFIF